MARQIDRNIPADPNPVRTLRAKARSKASGPLDDQHQPQPNLSLELPPLATTSNEWESNSPLKPARSPSPEKLAESNLALRKVRAEFKARAAKKRGMLTLSSDDDHEDDQVEPGPRLRTNLSNLTTSKPPPASLSAPAVDPAEQAKLSSVSGQLEHAPG